MARSLPKWLTRREDGVLVIDPDIAYPIAIKAAGIKDGECYRYHVECAYQHAKMAAQELVMGTEYWPATGTLQIHILPRRENWALANWKESPEGDDVARASRGLAAKRLYPMVRRALIDAE